MRGDYEQRQVHADAAGQVREPRQRDGRKENAQAPVPIYCHRSAKARSDDAALPLPAVRVSHNEGMTMNSVGAEGALSGTRPRPPFWAKLPVPVGNTLQLAGIVVGVLLVVAAAGVKHTAAASAVLAVVGIVLTAFSSHAIGHWLVGRIAGLRFAFIGVRGTDHPETYPPGARQVMSAVPMFTTVSTRRSRESAGRRALAAYFAAGQTTAVIGWVGSAILARALNIPGSPIILAIMIAWAAGTALVATFSPKGDYAKARAALRRIRGVRGVR